MFLLLTFSILTPCSGVSIITFEHVEHVTKCQLGREKSNTIHCLKYHNFIEFPGMEILWKGTFSAETVKNSGNCAFPLSFEPGN